MDGRWIGRWVLRERVCDFIEATAAVALLVVLLCGLKYYNSLLSDWTSWPGSGPLTPRFDAAHHRRRSCPEWEGVGRIHWWPVYKYLFYNKLISALLGTENNSSIMFQRVISGSFTYNIIIIISLLLTSSSSSSFSQKWLIFMTNYVVLQFILYMILIGRKLLKDHPLYSTFAWPTQCEFLLEFTIEYRPDHCHYLGLVYIVWSGVCASGVLVFDGWAALLCSLMILLSWNGWNSATPHWLFILHWTILYPTKPTLDNEYPGLAMEGWRIKVLADSIGL